MFLCVLVRAYHTNAYKSDKPFSIGPVHLHKFVEGHHLCAEQSFSEFWYLGLMHVSGPGHEERAHTKPRATRSPKENKLDLVKALSLPPLHGIVEMRVLICPEQ